MFSAEGDIVIAIPADMNPKSAMANTIVREFGRDELFKLRPQVGQVLIVRRNTQSCVHLLCTRASNQSPIFTKI